MHEVSPDFKIISCTSWSIWITVGKRNWYWVVTSRCLISILISDVWKLDGFSFGWNPAYFSVFAASTDSIFSADWTIIIGESKNLNQVASSLVTHKVKITQIYQVTIFKSILTQSCSFHLHLEWYLRQHHHRIGVLVWIELFLDVVMAHQ